MSLEVRSQIPKAKQAGHKRVTYSGELACNTASGQPWLYSQVANWDQVVLHNASGILLSAVRFPEGTNSNWYDGVNQIIDTNRSTLIGDSSHAAYPYVMQYSTFFSFVDQLPVRPEIYSCINVFTQTYDEIIAAIELYKAASGNSVINWELGNELNFASTYTSSVDDAFASLTGEDLALAYTWFPNGTFTSDGGDYAAKCKPVVDYIRANYPEDKIAISSTMDSDINSVYDLSATWDDYHMLNDAWVANCAKQFNFDGMIVHAYLHPDYMWTGLYNSGNPAYTDSQWLVGTSNSGENLYRWIMSFAQDGPAKIVSKSFSRCPNKELWFTEANMLLVPNNPDTVTNRPTEIEGQAAHTVYRVLWTISYMFSWLEQVSIFKDLIRTVMFHACGRATNLDTYNSHYNNEDYPDPVSLSSLGIAYYLMNKLTADMTHFEVPFIDTTAIDKQGVKTFSRTKLKPVRLVYFDNKTNKRAMILNISPDAHDVVVDFTPATYLRFVAADNSLGLWDNIPVSTFFDDTDFGSGSHTSQTYTAPAFSVTILED